MEELQISGGGKVEYYLSSMDSMILALVRKISVLRGLKFDTGKNALLVKVNEAIQIQGQDKFFLCDKFILTARHKGFDVMNIDTFPMFVYVCYFENEFIEYYDEVKKTDLKILGVGELYKTKDDALNHKFD